MTKKLKTERVAATKLEFHGELCIRGVAELKERLLRAIERAEVVEVDLTRADKIDVCVLQLFCAAQRLAVDLNCSLRLRGPLCASVQTAVAGSGLSALFDDPAVTPEPGCPLEEREGSL